MANPSSQEPPRDGGYKTFTLTTGRVVSVGDDSPVIFGNELELLDGSRIECIPRPEPLHPEPPQSDSHDPTGYYLIKGNIRCPNGAKFVTKEEHEQRRLARIAAETRFSQQIPLFVANADRILSDSRMFLAQVPVESGLAYSGTSGFRYPTLGVYIEWWRYFAASHCRIDGQDGLVWLIAGSPLSGSNRCGVCFAEDSWRTIQVSNFCDVWSSFLLVNRRYRDAKTLFEAYTMDEVIEILGCSSNEK